MIAGSPLDAIEHATLSHAFRFRIAVPEEFGKLPVYSNTARKADDVLSALDTEHGYLKRISLFGTRSCYKLTPRFATDFACDHDARRPIKEIDKLRAFAMLSFCLADADEKRQPLNALDFEDNFPDLFHAVPGANRNQLRFRDYYLAPPRLGFLRVDSGGGGHWDRLILKCERDLKKHRNIPAYRELIDDGHFELAVVTTFDTKAIRLRDTVRKHSFFDGVRVCVHAVPELIEFIAPPPLKSLSGLTIAPV